MSSKVLQPLGGLLFLAIACSGAQRDTARVAPPPEQVSPSPPAPAAPPSIDAGISSAPANAAPSSKAELTSQAKPDTTPAEGPTACAPGMQLVDGDYCTDVEQKCLRSWFDEPNKKVVCEEFEPHTTCTGQKVHKRFCIDAYSWPNVKGDRPEVMNNFYQAEVKCAAVGKRLCTESEWTLACEGPEMKPFPYGYVRDPKKCNGDQAWDGPDMKKVAARDPAELARLWQGVRNGSQPECVSDYGIADLPGNTDDVVASETFSDDWRGKYDSVHSGGPWYKGVRNQCRPKIYTHDEGFYYYFLSFRCCAEPDGATTDPRTPKQRKRNQGLNYVERLARFTVKAMQQKLELKSQGKCVCGEHDVLCKTMCGTLLGSDAKDIHP